MNKIGFALGCLFGFLLAGAGLTNYDMVHQGLLLVKPDMFLIMGSAMAVASLGIWAMERVGWVTPLQGPLKIRRISVERKHIYGALVFGIGWAVTGACPAVSAALAGSGSVYGAVVMAGLLAGILVFDFQKGRSKTPKTMPHLPQSFDNTITDAVFDVDNTLAKCNLVDFYLFIAKKQKPGWGRILLFTGVALQAPYYMTLNLVSRESFTRRFVRQKLEKFSYDELDAWAEEFFAETVSRRMIASTERLIRQLQDRQIRVVLLSTNYDLIVKRFGAYFGVPFICHKVMRVGDRAIFDCTDLTSFKERQIQAMPKESIGVGDSKYDLPVLNHVKVPFVVARKARGWFKHLHSAPYLLDPSVVSK